MTIVKLIILITGLLFVLPIVSYVIMKWGAAGYYRGKETGKKLNDELKNDNDNFSKE